MVIALMCVNVADATMSDIHAWSARHQLAMIQRTPTIQGLPTRAAWAKPVAVVAFIFGVLTVISGARVLFGDVSTRAAAGDVVLFVLRFNTLAGFAYMLAAVGLFRWRRWSARLAVLIALTTITVFAAFGWHIATGGAFEPRTLGAMVLRSGFWIVLAVAACLALDCRRTDTNSDLS